MPTPLSCGHEFMNAVRIVVLSIQAYEWNWHSCLYDGSSDRPFSAEGPAPFAGTSGFVVRLSKKPQVPAKGAWPCAYSDSDGSKWLRGISTVVAARDCGKLQFTTVLSFAHGNARVKDEQAPRCYEWPCVTHTMSICRASSSGMRFVSRTNPQRSSGPKKQDSTIRPSREQSPPAIFISQGVL